MDTTDSPSLPPATQTLHEDSTIPTTMDLANPPATTTAEEIDPLHINTPSTEMIEESLAAMPVGTPNTESTAEDYPSTSEPVSSTAESASGPSTRPFKRAAKPVPLQTFTIQLSSSSKGEASSETLEPHHDFCRGPSYSQTDDDFALHGPRHGWGPRPARGRYHPWHVQSRRFVPIGAAKSRDSAKNVHPLFVVGYDPRNRTPREPVVRGIIPYIMHGTDEDGNPFSFIVFLFRMVTWGMGIRFREVHIDITFGPTDEHLEDSASPVVHVLSPWGPNRYHISEHDRSKTISPEISAALKLAGIDVGSKVVWSITKGGSLFDCISVEGDFDFSPRAIPDRPDMACWYLLENSSSRTGVPPLLMTAVMLKRRQEDELKPFKCDIRIDSWVAKERGCLFERKPRKMDGGNDKIIIFDPKIAGRVGRFKKYVHRIPKIPLEKVSGVVSDQGLKIEPWWMRMRRRDEESDDEEEQETWEAAQEKEKMRRERRRRREEDSDDGEEQGIWEEAQEKKEMKRERKRRRRGGKRKRERRERRYLRHKMECEEKMKRMKRAEEERRKMEEQKNSARCLCVVM